MILKDTKKRRELSLLILYRVSPNTSSETNNNYTPTPYMPGQNGVDSVWNVHIQNRRTGVLHPSLFEIGDFAVKDKARNAFLAGGFLPVSAAKLRKRIETCKLFGGKEIKGI